MSKTAILQVADAGPCESIVVMLQAVGYRCYLPSEQLRNELRRIGCDTVLSPKDLTRQMGYSPVMDLLEARIADMQATDLYVDIKAHRNASKVWNKWPILRKKTLWYRINGGYPEHVINARGDHGDEVNPICPILTPNMWYKEQIHDTTTKDNIKWRTCVPAPWRDKAYACWPPFMRFNEYYQKYDRRDKDFDSPMCLIHNLQGWGYQKLVKPVREMGVKCYGAGSPDGLIDHSLVGVGLSKALCMVHLKSSDAPGYSIYEALAAKCPIICTRRLIWRNRMESLLIPNETCLVFDRETHDELSDKDVEECTTEIKQHLEYLSLSGNNLRIGENGYNKLQEVMWNKNRLYDVKSLDQFMKRMYP